MDEDRTHAAPVEPPPIEHAQKDAFLRDFLADFFPRYGCRVESSGTRLHVTIPQGEDASAESRELATRFARDALTLVFDPHEAAAGVDLVAPGGHVLRTVEEFLERRGRRAYVVAPAVKKLEKSLVVDALSPMDKVKLALDERSDEEAWDAHFTFRVRYRGRERQDALLHVLVPVRASGPLEARAAPPPALAETWEAHPRKHLAEPLLKDAFARAASLVDELASREALELEARARVRLERDASRLEVFYDTAVREQQTNRTATEVARAKIEELEEERALKRRELLESARVDAEAEPLQLLVVERPRRRVAVRVSRPRRSEEPALGQVELAFDLSTGEVEAPPCPACRKALSRVTACDSGHAVHQGCAETCVACDRVVCAACGAVACARCGKTTGPEHATTCERCSQPVCPEHLGACSRCGSKRCTGCLHACAHCGKLACEGDSLALGEGTAAFLCTGCGVACADCGRPEPESALSRCAGCGRRFCSSCTSAKGKERICKACAS